MAGHREQLKQRLAGLVERRELTVGRPRGRAKLGDDAAAADDRHVVTDRAARAVERRPQAFIGRLDFEEILEAQPELLELRRRDSRERTAGDRTSLGERENGRRPEQHEPHGANANDGRRAHSVTTISPRMNEWPAPQTCEHWNV